MRYSEKGEFLQGKGNGFFGGDFHEKMIRDFENEPLELSGEFSPSSRDIRKWKKRLSRS
ncbi:hypothetical protein [Metabacillus sp. RGM 3146]|uniref:hypothetical protein n=1 Tax=Metabacillus sp. RGM 3146 TaxID=3401092 RepID=UPI003B9B24EB